MKKSIFGHMPDGRAVHEYVLENGQQSVHILDLGGTVRRWLVKGNDIVLGFDSVKHILSDTSYMGALVGRVANRIRNGCFTLNGKTYRLEKNENGRSHLHGGKSGFNRKIWNVDFATDTSLSLSCFSPNGEEGYPGNLRVSVDYTLEKDTLVISYRAESDEDTPVNLTNHSYFNLNGFDSGDILDHTAVIYAKRYTEVGEDLLPTGERPEVENTVFDFLTPHTFGERMGDGFGGYDHNFWLSPTEHEKIGDMDLPLVASVVGEKLTMDVFTDQPCMQLYCAGGLSGEPPMKDGIIKEPFHAFCMETQEEPDSVNRGLGILKKGEIYDKKTAYRIRPIE